MTTLTIQSKKNNVTAHSVSELITQEMVVHQSNSVSIGEIKDLQLSPTISTANHELLIAKSQVNKNQFIVDTTTIPEYVGTFQVNLVLHIQNLPDFECALNIEIS